jgi:hypothetical protein
VDVCRAVHGPTETFHWWKLYSEAIITAFAKKYQQAHPAIRSTLHRCFFHKVILCVYAAPTLNTTLHEIQLLRDRNCTISMHLFGLQEIQLSPIWQMNYN